MAAFKLRALCVLYCSHFYLSQIWLKAGKCSFSPNAFLGPNMAENYARDTLLNISTVTLQWVNH